MPGGGRGPCPRSGVDLPGAFAASPRGPEASSARDGRPSSGSRAALGFTGQKPDARRPPPEKGTRFVCSWGVNSSLGLGTSTLATSLGFCLGGPQRGLPGGTVTVPKARPANEFRAGGEVSAGPSARRPGNDLWLHGRSQAPRASRRPARAQPHAGRVPVPAGGRSSGEEGTDRPGKSHTPGRCGQRFRQNPEGESSPPQTQCGREGFRGCAGARGGGPGNRTAVTKGLRRESRLCCRSRRGVAHMGAPGELGAWGAVRGGGSKMGSAWGRQA